MRMRPVSFWGICASVVLGTAGCAGQQFSPHSAATTSPSVVASFENGGIDRRLMDDSTHALGSDAPAPETKKLYLDLVKEMLNKRLYHAALAYLLALENQDGKLTPEGRYLRAEALRHLQRLPEAQALYQDLLRTPYAAEGHHGLGLIASAQNDMPTALDHFRQATQLRPTDARIRNDLGYALLLKGDLNEAKFHLLTALELGGEKKRTGRNLVLLYSLQGDTSKAEKLVTEAGLSPQEVAFLQNEALRLKNRMNSSPSGVPSPRSDPMEDGGSLPPNSPDSDVVPNDTSRAP